MLEVTRLFVDVLKDVVKRRRRIDAPSELRRCAEHGCFLRLDDPKGPSYETRNSRNRMSTYSEAIAGRSSWVTSTSTQPSHTLSIQSMLSNSEMISGFPTKSTGTSLGSSRTQNASPVPPRKTRRPWSSVRISPSDTSRGEGREPWKEPTSFTFCASTLR